MLDGLKRLIGKVSGVSTGLRRYDAASGTKRAGAIGTFPSYRSATAGAAGTIRSRARYLAENAPLVTGAVDNLVAHLVGPGSRPIPDASEAVRRALARDWRNWTGFCDYAEEVNFAAIETEAVRAMIVDGEALIELVTTSDGLRLRALPAELIDSQKTVNLSGAREIIAGVEYDGTGRTVAFWLHPRPTGLLTGYQPSVRVPAGQIIRLWRRPRPGAVRGVSWLSPVVIAAAETDGLLDALTVGARVSASVAGFVISPDASPEPDAMPDLSGALNPGTVTDLPAGYDVRFNTPQAFTRGDGLLKFGVRQIGAGLGVPTHLVDGDMSDANYSSLRAATVAFRARINAWRSTLITPLLLDRVWRYWQAAENLAGRSTFPMVSADWIGAPIEGIDPAKDAAAVQKRIELRLTSRRAEILASGRDPDRVDAEIQAEQLQVGIPA